MMQNDIRPLAAVLDLLPGVTLPPLPIPPVTRAALALYAGASGDHNPMHIDSDFARKSGAPDVFAHGMLVMAYLGRLLTDTFGADALVSWDARFVAVTPVGATLLCTAVVADAEPRDGKHELRLALSVKDTAGELKVEGTARVRS